MLPLSVGESKQKVILYWILTSHLNKPHDRIVFKKINKAIMEFEDSVNCPYVLSVTFSVTTSFQI